MRARLSIGEFSRVTHLSVKALRHYHDVALLAPAAVDPVTGYRSYATAQIPTAHLIRRLRDLDMPIDDIRAVLNERDPAERDATLFSHLERAERHLARAQAAVASMRALLSGDSAPLPITYREAPRVTVLAIREPVDWDGTEAWLETAFGELAVALGTGPAERAGPDSALYPPAYFEDHEADVTAFVAVEGTALGRGRAEVQSLPAGLFAVAAHDGDFADLDRTYGALGAFVAEQGIGAEGPVREHYLTSASGAERGARTEVCWPITSIPVPRTLP